MPPDVAELEDQCDGLPEREGGPREIKWHFAKNVCGCRMAQQAAVAAADSTDDLAEEIERSLQRAPGTRSERIPANKPLYLP
jgi:hypothetical protein